MILPLLLSAAFAGEYRELELSDGRVIRGEVLDSSAAGISMRLHQGTASISYDDVLRIDPIEQEIWDAEPPWRVYVTPVLPDTSRLQDAADQAYPLVAGALSRIPAVEVVQERGGPLESLVAIRACGRDEACVIRHAGEAGIDLVLVGSLETRIGADDQLALTALFADASRAWRTASIPWSGADPRAPVVALHLLYTSLGLSPDPEVVEALLAQLDGGAPLLSPPSPPPLSREQVLALSFVPIPGFPSLYQRDLRRFGLSWAAVAPVTAIFVGVSGAASTQKGQFLTLGLAGYYVTNTAVNQVMGLKTLENAPLFTFSLSQGGAVAGFTLPLP